MEQRDDSGSSHTTLSSASSSQILEHVETPSEHDGESNGATRLSMEHTSD